MREVSIETRRKMSRSHMGHKQTEETKRKIRLHHPNHSMENHPYWKGGKVVKNGYLYIRNTKHPNRTANGYVKNCKLVMEKHLGRYILPGEQIHHINGDKQDDRIENLKLMSKKEHDRLHYWKKFPVMRKARYGY